MKRLTLILAALLLSTPSLAGTARKGSNISAGGVVSSGNTIGIDGADGTCTLSVNDVNNTLVWTCPSGYSMVLPNNQSPITQADIIRQTDTFGFNETADIVTNIDDEALLRAGFGSVASGGTATYSGQAVFKFVTLAHTVTNPAVVESIDCMFVQLNGFDAGVDSIDICPYEVPIGSTQADVISGVHDLSTCMTVSSGSTDCTTVGASVGQHCTTVVGEALSDVESAIGLVFRNAVDADASANLQGACTVRWTGELAP